jgi:hypothetical protein
MIVGQWEVKEKLGGKIWVRFPKRTQFWGCFEAL